MAALAGDWFDWICAAYSGWSRRRTPAGRVLTTTDWFDWFCAAYCQAHRAAHTHSYFILTMPILIPILITHTHNQLLELTLTPVITIIIITQLRLFFFHSTSRDLVLVYGW